MPGRPQGIAPTMDGLSWEADSQHDRGDPLWSRSLGRTPHFHQDCYSPTRSLGARFGSFTVDRLIATGELANIKMG